MNKFCPSASHVFNTYSVDQLEHVAHVFYDCLVLFRKKEEVQLFISALLTNSHPEVFMRCIISDEN